VRLPQTLSTFSQESGQHHDARGDRAVLITHLGAAYNLARWLMRDKTEAEDAVQEAYLRAISHFASFRSGDGRAWLLTIVRNCCFNRLRQRGASGLNTDFDEAVHSFGGQTPNPETELLQAERTKLVRKSLDELPATYREVIVLREMEQLSYREIANIAGVPLGTVMSRLNRARQHLHQAILNASSSASAARHTLNY
jgi:RNA polymerase sigma-70 factor (ECF subfamily)